jgi:hypothetical protein
MPPSFILEGFDAVPASGFPAIDSGDPNRHPAPMPTAHLASLSSQPRAAAPYYVYRQARTGPD